MSKCVADSCCQMEIPFEMLDVHNHPTVSDLQRNMGKSLTDVYLKTCTPIERTLFGRDTALKGPDKLWINPADRLSGDKVQLTPLFTESLQAFTHRGILEIGKKLEQKFDAHNQLMIEKAVAEAEELADYETRQKIKFHVESEASKLNAEWHRRLSDQNAQHDAEKKCLKRIYEDGRELLKSFIEEKCKLETEKLLCKAVKDTTLEMERKFSVNVERELAQQLALFDEQLENTLSNLKINDRQRMEEMRSQCLSAMDLQSHLMSVRQISELMHLMTVEKQFWKSKLAGTRRDLVTDEALSDCGTSSTPAQNNQSKSIKRLWIEFLQRVDDFAGEKLDGDEMRICREIHHVRDKMMKQPGNYDGTSTIPSAAHDIAAEQAETQSPATIQSLFPPPSVGTDRFVDVAWEKMENNGNDSDTDDSFSCHALKQFLQPQNSLHPEIASSIKNVMKKVRELQLDKNMAGVIHDAMLAEFASFNSLRQAVDFVPMPKTEVVTIRDSLKVLEKRVSLQEDPEAIETPLLIEAVDSLELISLHSHGSHANSRKTSHENEISPLQGKSQSSPAVLDPTTNSAKSRDSKLTRLSSFNSPKRCSRTQDVQSSSPAAPSPQVSPSTSSHLPPYMRLPPKVCKNYAKMSQDDWSKLKTPRRRTTFAESSVQLDGERESARTKSRNFSILHHSFLDREKPQTDNNAMLPIQKRCRDTLVGMNVESLLMMLCDEDDKSNAVDDA